MSISTIKHKYILIGTKKIHYLENDNDKPTVLFLHAWPASSVMWDKVAENLSKNYHIVAPDLPGFGDSEELGKKHNIENYVEFIHDFIKEKRLDTFFMVGYSFGSILSAEYVLKFPHKVIALVLGAMPVYYKDFIPLKARMLDKFTKTCAWSLGLINAINKSEFNKHQYTNSHPYVRNYISAPRIEKYYEDMVSYSNKAAIDTFHEIVHIDLRRKVGKIHKQTLIIATDHDNRVHLEHAKKLNKAIKSSELVVIKDGDHALPCEHPKEYADTLDTFFKKVLSRD